MIQSLEMIFPHEYGELLEALRRDMRSQSQLSSNGTEWNEWHGNNVRIVKRLLEALNPRDTREESYEPTKNLQQI